jgi:nicotinamidase-related amidase
VIELPDFEELYRGCSDPWQVGTSFCEQRKLSLPAAAKIATERIDLVVLSEFLYYLDSQARAATLDLVDRVAAAPAEVVAMHWGHHPHDAHPNGAAVQNEIPETLAGRGWGPAVRLGDPDFFLHTRGRAERPDE